MGTISNADPDTPRSWLSGRVQRSVSGCSTAIGSDRVIVALGLGTLVSALTLRVNPWPQDHWFETQYTLFGRFPGADNYSPVAAPAVFYRLCGLLARALHLDQAGEFYLASLAQNLLMLFAGVLIYYSCRRLKLTPLWGGAAAALFLLYVLSLGLPQAFWSENVALFLFAAVAYLNVSIYADESDASRKFWIRAMLGSLCTGLLVITRVTPVLVIPAVLLLLYERLGRRRWLAYGAAMTLTTGLLMAAMLASNHARFGRVELTSSSGRHLWQGVWPMADAALADSPEFQELMKLNPGIQELNFWDLTLPSDERGALGGDAMLGRLALEAIRNAPLTYLSRGIDKFARTIGQAPYQLGSRSWPGDRQYDPLQTDEFLAPLAESIPGVPPLAIRVPPRVLDHVFTQSRTLYPVVIFFVLTTYGDLLIRRLRTIGPKLEIAIHLISGLAIAALISGLAIAAPVNRRTLALCLPILCLQLWVVHRERNSVRPVAFLFPQLYTFSALLFFGSLWFSWQIEQQSSRNAIPYLPFLALMCAMAVLYWSNRYGAIAGPRAVRSLTGAPS